MINTGTPAPESALPAVSPHNDTSKPDTRVVFGIKTKLSLAFLVLTALTAIACAVAWIVFVQIEKSVSVITQHSIPEITLALNIAEVSADITASAPAIIASSNQAERSSRREQLDAAGRKLEDLITRWKQHGIAPDVAENLSAAAAAITDKIAAADQAVENRLMIAARLDQQSALLDRTHASFLETLEPLIDDAVFDLVIKSETGNEEAAAALGNIVERGTMRLDRLSGLKADANLLVGLLREMAAHQTASGAHSADKILGQTQSEFARDLSELSQSDADAAVRRSGEELLAQINARIDDPADRLSQLTATHDRFLLVIEPGIAATRNRLLNETQSMSKQQATAMTDLVDTGSLALLYLQSLRSEGNLAVGILREAAHVSDDTLLTPLRERFDTAAGQMDRALRLIPGTLDLSQLRSTIGMQLGIGRGGSNVFALKRSQLSELEIAEQALDQIRTQSQALGSAVAALVQIAEKISDSTEAETQQVLDNSKFIMLVISFSSVLCALLVTLVFVGPRLIRPIEQTTRAMTRLAAGDTAVDIPGRDRADELGRMAHALGVFRDITIEVQESNLREIETARRRLSDAIESISEAFSLYDRDDRLVVCNRKYGTLVHPEIADEILPGQTFEQIIRRALESGFIEAAHGREEEWLAERLVRHNDPGAPHLMQRTDGIWIMVSEHRTAEGGIVAVYSDITELKERENELAEKSRALEQLSGQLSKYLSPQVYQSIFSGQQAATVASQRKKLTVFFSDLEGFTEIADRLESEDLSHLLNEYLTEMSKIALDHGATIDKYIGDSVMIFFGDPVSQGLREDALACVRMAIAMQKRLSELAEVWRGHGLAEELKSRIGIATGFCTVGNFGSEDRMDYTIIGGAVNLASWLESIAEPGAILISDETRTLVQNDIACREHETIRIKGFAYPVKTYFVVDEQETRVANRISERQAKLSLDLDLDAMSDEERQQAAGLLRDVMQKLDGDRDKP